jgi:hypothetical protein
MSLLYDFSSFYCLLGNSFFSQLKVGLATHCWRWAVILNPLNQEAIENFRFLGHLLPQEFTGSQERSWLRQAPRQEDWILKNIQGKVFTDNEAYRKKYEELLEIWETTPRLELGSKSPGGDLMDK